MFKNDYESLKLRKSKEWVVREEVSYQFISLMDFFDL